MIPKIQSAEEREKKEKKMKLIMTVVVVAILGASTAAYALMETGTSESKKYNGFTFIRTENGWQPKKMDFVTSYLPQDVENITVSGSLSIDDFSGNAYINAKSSQEIMAANELLKTLKIDKATVSCSPEEENETFCADMPIKSCDDADATNSIIVFSRTDANESTVSYKSHCLIIEGPEDGAIKAADRIIFLLYGIIK